MSRPPKPTSLLSPSYLKKKKVRKARENEPIGLDSLTARPRLPSDASACWDAILRLAPPGVLKNSDAIIVELAARLWARLRKGKGNAAEANQLRACLTAMGMTPSARVNVRAGDTPDRNEFADA
jgi:hypothetical protein